jgi:hypothetical protein
MHARLARLEERAPNGELAISDAERLVEKLLADMTTDELHELLRLSIAASPDAESSGVTPLDMATAMRRMDEIFDRTAARQLAAEANQLAEVGKSQLSDAR